MVPVSRILWLATSFGALIGGGLAWAIASSLFWGGLIGGALTGAAIGVVCVLMARAEQEK